MHVQIGTLDIVDGVTGESAPRGGQIGMSALPADCVVKLRFHEQTKVCRRAGALIRKSRGGFHLIGRISYRRPS